MLAEYKSITDSPPQISKVRIFRCMGGRSGREHEREREGERDRAEKEVNKVWMRAKDNTKLCYRVDPLLVCRDKLIPGTI